MEQTDALFTLRHLLMQPKNEHRVRGVVIRAEPYGRTASYGCEPQVQDVSVEISCCKTLR